ncbi:MAG: hypothetical protein OJJ54_17845 [Pseudonocardia sp.]|nr:hypothetical protein [Pseudonocardia sp.]
MQVINTGHAAAEDALVALAGHVPADVAIGRPLVATPGDEGSIHVLTATTNWWVYPDHADRLAVLADGRGELTEFRGGREVSRTIAVIE